jgi:crotonobetainyl-CoA:carnitine CoA-transferase CaiB-like acyl-CoA transferase
MEREESVRRETVRGRAAALEHLGVIDLTDLRGALAGRMLAELGADVIKIEPPGGDPDRLRPPVAATPAAAGHSLPFLFRNAGKRGAVIDLETAPGRERFEGLAAQADILLENLGPVEQARLHLTPDAVRARHPHLVHVTISDFGLSGPHARWRLEPLTAFAASGALHGSGLPDRPPCWLPGYLAHDCASIFGVTGALAAVLDRARHGRGQTVEVSVQEAALNGLDPWSIPLADYARRYPLFPTSAPRDGDGAYLVLPTLDGYVRVVPGTPRQLAAFARLLWEGAAEGEPGGTHPHLPREDAAAHRAYDGASRHDPDAGSADAAGGPAAAWLESLPFQALGLANGALLGASRILTLPGLTLSVVHGFLAVARALAGRALRYRSRAEVLAAALRLGVPMAPVNTPEDFVVAAQTRARDYFRTTGFPHLGDAPLASAPWRLSVTPARLRRPAPGLGEDDGRGFVTCPETGPALRGGTARPANAGSETASGPILAGMRVINLGVGAVGPELCWLLGELGAEVIKIESQASVDFLRRMTLEIDNPNTSFPFNDDCRGQKSVCLDLHTGRAREIALRLCASADVVVENHRGGVVRAWGLDYPDVQRVHPGVIYVASQGYGRGGPLGEAPAFGPLASAFAGATWLWNHPDASYPAGSSLNHPDHIASKLGAVAVLAALEHRRRTGEGQFIDLAQSEAAAYLLGEFYLERALTGRPTRQRGNAVDYACPHGVYPCAGDDSWCAIAVVGDEAWERFRLVLGWPEQPRLARLEGRLAARAELDPRVAAWTRARQPEEAAGILQSAGVSAMPVQGPDEHRVDPHLAARGALVTVVDPEVGPTRHTANPLRMSRMGMSPHAPAPRLGEHTIEVLTRVLGLGEGEVTALVAQGVCR